MFAYFSVRRAPVAHSMTVSRLAFFAREFPDDAALVHHENPVAHAEHLFEFGGDDDDGCALFGEPVQKPVDFDLGADIDAAGWFVQDEDFRARIQPARQQHLLLVAAAERSDDGIDAGGLDVKLSDIAFGQRAFFVAVDHADRRRAHGLQRRDRGVEGDRLAEEQAERLAILGQKRNSVFDRVRRRADFDLFAVDQHVAMGCFREGAEDRGGECGPARAHQAGDSQDFAAIGGKGDVRDLPRTGQGGVIDGEVPHVENLLAARVRRMRIHLVQLAPDHPFDDLVERDVGDRRGRADGPAVAQHHDAIGDLRNLLHLVRDVAHADAGLPQAPDHAEKLGDFLVRQRRGRFIEDEDTRTLRQRLGDFDHLLLSDRDVSHPVGRLDVGYSEFTEEGGRVGVHPAPVDGAEAVGRLAVEKDVFGNRELGDQVELLMDDGDACIHRFAG